MKKIKKMILRQSLQNRIVHWGVAVSTFALIISGMFQMPVSKRYMINELPLMAWSGDYHISLIMHYVGAFSLIFFVSFHLFFHIARAEFDIFPKKGDGVKSLKIIKTMLFGGVEPKSEKYLPEQRLAYFFIGLVLLLLISTGLIKTAKNLAGWNLSEGLYFWSAQLHNLGMILIILGIIGHLAAFIFKANRPLLRAMFSGKVDANYIKERHSLWEEGVKMADKES
ncbi:cytochrome b/b6 domain-containing protein [Campylobacter vulpis]|uniref:Cytochrome b/b6 domain-containing protein n=1 Tax=Campylobacter vulpis TaxID=1655500 RepID=A0A2G4R6B8_9BACT|nr:cytochrome b/b6 domain-containing protein [Campylobacter vulpis]MBS4240189.1 cytochrome b/b6 domain-containing protein [Campylobacter vulpis]MBS4252125.1 cytochrome b/b6 domain-containing protein [Campylobacter vulpis]MBS4281000.1 cytochrome b/b6 domain-containing protein [Campylobacter vulpis]MBS4329505.1 cytochrome b/b6 domain-containing protein [Campylobacter vulpis]MBS4331895.1 cytochrome b/b6 domain-containing protein [Campylobacter vulpis]